jgi:SAM-dependent methyltransferase
LQSKTAYYTGRKLKPSLARRYWRTLGAAERVLDVGCGTGELGRYAPPGVEVHGVDHDPGAVARAAAFERAVCVDLETEALPYESGSFQAVLAKDVFEHLHRPEAILREIHRVLAPGGTLLASVVVAYPRRVWDDYTHIRGYTAAAARNLVEDAGFDVERLEGMGGVPLSDRLGFMNLVPSIVRLPVARQLWLSSWEIVAKRP